MIEFLVAELGKIEVKGKIRTGRVEQRGWKDTLSVRKGGAVVVESWGMEESFQDEESCREEKRCVERKGGSGWEGDGK